MIIDKSAVIHTIQVIASQDQRISGAGGFDLDGLFADGIGRALVPFAALVSLFGC